MGTPDSNTSARELGAGQIYRRLLAYCLPHWRVFLVAALGMAVYAATDTGFAYLINKLISAIGAPPAAEGPYQELIRACPASRPACGSQRSVHRLVLRSSGPIGEFGLPGP